MAFLRSSDSYGDIARELEANCLPFFQSMGVATSEARRMFREMFDRVVKDAIAEGTIDAPLDYGDLLLRRQHQDDNVRRRLDKKRQDGVTDEDIRGWWNSHDLERRMMLAQDNVMKLAFYNKLVQGEGLTEEDALTRLRKNHPNFGDPDDTTKRTAEDRPLPVELKDRVNVYMIRRMAEDPTALKRDVEQASTYNALVRREIKLGRL